MLLTLSAPSILPDSLSSRSTARRSFPPFHIASLRGIAPLGNEGSSAAASAPPACAMTAAPIADDLRALDAGAHPPLLQVSAGKGSAELAERKDGAQQPRGECSQAGKRKLSASGDAEFRAVIHDDAAAAAPEGSESNADSTRSAETAAKKPRGSSDDGENVRGSPSAAPPPATAAEQRSSHLAGASPFDNHAAGRIPADAAAGSGESGGAESEEGEEAEGEEGEGGGRRRWAG
ncbi:hypothetical protein CLOM_g14647 [Closterium sp. NIES-68]|nr:hypothetical protein CLOM_g14647 [Closterium sp. NIES-68]GJP69663.1 hypothetical protein CLOP_g650 [Closterium sp. NIES-67]